MFPKLSSWRTSIGLDLQGDRFCAVRVKINHPKVELTHHLETPDLAELGKGLERADLVVVRPPPNTWFNRRQSAVESDWTGPDAPSIEEQGLEVFKIAQRWTPLPMKETLYGWSVLSYDKATRSTELEIHQSEHKNCRDYRATLESLGLGPVQFEAWHSTALSFVIPPRFHTYLLETRAPGGYALVKDGALVGHLPAGFFSPLTDNESPDREKFLLFLKEHLAKTGQLQAFFLDRSHPTPRYPGLSCSWIGENCRELLGRELTMGCLQALGLALSSRKEWWLHHVSEFLPTPGPLQKLKSAIDEFRR